MKSKAICVRIFWIVKKNPKTYKRCDNPYVFVVSILSNIKKLGPTKLTWAKPHRTPSAQYTYILSEITKFYSH